MMYCVRRGINTYRLQRQTPNRKARRAGQETEWASQETRQHFPQTMRPA